MLLISERTRQKLRSRLGIIPQSGILRADTRMHDSYVSFFFDEMPVDFSEIVSIAISGPSTLTKTFILPGILTSCYYGCNYGSIKILYRFCDLYSLRCFRVSFYDIL